MKFKDIQYTFTANYGRGRTGKTVTAQVLGSAGVVSANATIGSVIELGHGNYGGTITFTLSFNGYIKFNNTTDSIVVFTPFICVDDYRLDITILKQIETNRWKIVSNQLIIYADDATTPLYTFDLKKAGVTNGESPDERLPA